MALSAKWLMLAVSLASASALERNVTVLSYAGQKNSIYAFLHAYDSLPKVLLLRQEAAPQQEPENEGKRSGKPKIDEGPSWFTSVALRFKDGHKKSASFAYMAGDDAKKAAVRFGLQELPPSGIVIGCAVDGKGSGSFAVFDRLSEERMRQAVSDMRQFVQSLVDGKLEGRLLPDFPVVDVPPRGVSLVELTEESMHTNCFGGAKSLCVIALLPFGSASCPAAFRTLAAAHKKDAVQFAWLQTALQTEFLAEFGVESAQLPLLLAVRTGRRKGFTLSESERGLSSDAMAAFMEKILSGSATFKKLSELPKLAKPEFVEAEDKTEL